MKINYEYFLRRRKCTSETLIKANDLNTIKKFNLFLNSINVKLPEDKIYEEAFKNVYTIKKDESIQKLSTTPILEEVEEVEVQEVLEEITVDIKDDAIKPKKRTRRRSRKKSTTSWILFCFCQDRRHWRMAWEKYIQYLTWQCIIIINDIIWGLILWV